MSFDDFRRAALRPDRRSGLVNGVLSVSFLVSGVLVALVWRTRGFLPETIETMWNWFSATFWLTLIVVNVLLIANAARRAQRAERRQPDAWEAWIDRLTRLLPQRRSTRGYFIYEHAAGDVQAVKSGFRWWPLFFVPFWIVWAIQVRFWWLVLITLIHWSASAFVPDDSWSLRPLSAGLTLVFVSAYIAAFFEADDLEGRRFEKIGYTLVDHIHGRSGPHAVGLYRAQAHGQESPA